MTVVRAPARRAFETARLALEKAQTAVKNRAPVATVASILRTEFQEAVNEANNAGVFTGYLQKSAEHLYNKNEEAYPLQARPSSMGWTVTVVGEVTDETLQAGKEALDGLFEVELEALHHLREHAGKASETAVRLKDEGQLLLKLRELTDAGVDPTFLEGQIELIGQLIRGEPPTQLQQYQYAAMKDAQGAWHLETL